MYYWVQQFDNTNDSMKSNKRETQWLSVQMNDYELHFKGQESIFIHYDIVAIEVHPDSNIDALKDIFFKTE